MLPYPQSLLFVRSPGLCTGPDSRVGGGGISLFSGKTTHSSSLGPEPGFPIQKSSGGLTFQSTEEGFSLGRWSFELTTGLETTQVLGTSRGF